MAPPRSSRLTRLRESMWFTPGLMVIGAIVLAEVVVLVDHLLPEDAGSSLPGGGLSLGVEGSRGILVTVGGSVLAVAATMFSITMAVIATASSTYGPRLVRNFMADRSNQRVLGLFVSTFTYCLIVLLHVEDPSKNDSDPVPQLAIYGAIALALLCVGALVYFLHHIADVIQVATLVRRVRLELERAAESLYGEQAHTDRQSANPLPSTARAVDAHGAGFVTTVDSAQLVAAAHDHDGLIDLLATPGTHVIEGEPLALITGGDDLADAVRRHVHLGDVRSPTQDILGALQQLVEMAVRAVSPSMNDPYTARNAVDEVACGLVPALTGPAPLPGWSGPDGRLRLRWAPPSREQLVDTVFDDLRTYGSSDPIVIRAAIRLAGRLLVVADRQTRTRLHRHLDEMLAAAVRSGLPEFDVARLQTEREHLAPNPVSGPTPLTPGGR